ncbi:hypothetical protein [Zobellella aerophila]|uniref:Uncharacterized protein n=1 Tax=Zobellella aerophila TaxID=870480 RepID=A0ABP6V5T8_9GAMM
MKVLNVLPTAWAKIFPYLVYGKAKGKGIGQKHQLFGLFINQLLTTWCEKRGTRDTKETFLFKIGLIGDSFDILTCNDLFIWINILILMIKLVQ